LTSSAFAAPERAPPRNQSSSLRAVVQRVSEASVLADGELVGAIGSGLLVLLGVGRSDGPREASRLAEKIARLRLFDSEDGRMDRSVVDLGDDAAVLCISQFTLYGDVRRGLRPSFTQAAAGEEAEGLYEEFCRELERQGVKVETGRFGARMSVSLTNEGPVTLLVEMPAPDA
jgi:D-tyrosyl-tRNA(Tyr) deacylase